MYRMEVPLYGALLDIVHGVDRSVMSAAVGMDAVNLPARHELERHGAIRLGSQDELRNIARLFAIMGMHPVGYYDLTLAGLPLHATAFRPISENELHQNPFRVFTSLLRYDLLPPRIRALAEGLIQRRRLFQPRLLHLISLAERECLLHPGDVEELIHESVDIFRWHASTNVSASEYYELKTHHPVVADIVCFPNLHINHLTPRTLDIDLVQDAMQKHGMPVKERIEGPPRRKCNILLRQTSFKAVEERVNFRQVCGLNAAGTHAARFGEVEQRGAAMTPEGRYRYDCALAQADADAVNQPEKHELLLEASIRDLVPDDWTELRRRQLVYFRYVPIPQHHKPNERPNERQNVKMDRLIDEGVVHGEPITYEDFLPLSAAGIFDSNLKDSPAKTATMFAEVGKDGLRKLENVLNTRILSEFDLYGAVQKRSILECEEALGIDISI